MTIKISALPTKPHQDRSTEMGSPKFQPIHEKKISNTFSYVDIQKDSSIPFDKIPKFLPVHEGKHLDQLENTFGI